MTGTADRNDAVACRRCIWASAVSATAGLGALWDELGLARFWREAADRGGCAVGEVVQLLAINRPCEPGSEFTLHRLVPGQRDGRALGHFARRRRTVCIAWITAGPGGCASTCGRWKTLFDANFDILCTT
jgi:hypothetical protein